MSAKVLVVDNYDNALEKNKIPREARAESLNSDIIFSLFRELKKNYK